MKRSKQELLAHYAEREPLHLEQIDGWLNFPKGDPWIVADEDGDALMATDTIELMQMGGGPSGRDRGNGSISLRILIRTDVSEVDAARLLRKAAEWIERREALPPDEPRATKQFDDDWTQPLPDEVDLSQPAPAPLPDEIQF